MQQKIHNKHALTIEQLLEKHARSWAKRQKHLRSGQLSQGTVYNIKSI